MKPSEAIHDTDRVEYYRGYTRALLEAANLDGVDIRSYFAWSEYIILGCIHPTDKIRFRFTRQFRMG